MMAWYIDVCLMKTSMTSYTIAIAHHMEVIINLTKQPLKCLNVDFISLQSLEMLVNSWIDVINSKEMEDY